MACFFSIIFILLWNFFDQLLCNSGPSFSDSSMRRNDSKKKKDFAPPEAYEHAETVLSKKYKLDSTISGFQAVSDSEKYKPEGFSRYQVTNSIEGDGNCQFKAFAMLVKGDQSLHEEFRRAAVNYIKKYPEEFQDFIAIDSGETLKEYCERMSLRGTYGDELTMVSLARHYQKNVILVKDTEEHEDVFHVDFGGGKIQDPFLGLYLHNEHYELLLEYPEKIPDIIEEHAPILDARAMYWGKDEDQHIPILDARAMYW